MRGCHDGTNPVSEGHLAHIEGFLPFLRSVIQIRKYVAVDVDHLKYLCIFAQPLLYGFGDFGELGSCIIQIYALDRLNLFLFSCFFPPSSSSP